jgi:hypothetical protein
MRLYVSYALTEAAGRDSVSDCKSPEPWSILGGRGRLMPAGDL